MNDDPFGPKSSQSLANDLSVMAYHLQGLAERLSGIADYSDFDEAVLARAIRAAIAHDNPALMRGLLHEIANALDKDDVAVRLQVVADRAGNLQRKNRTKRFWRDLRVGLKDRSAVRRAFVELQEHGFIVKAKASGFNLKDWTDRRATEWRLEWLPASGGFGKPEVPASKAFMRWPNIERVSN